MGSSTKKKKEKQKDFQKTKLKVGKAKGKPENFTDTSFKSKGITLNQQSLNLSAPTTTSQFTHHISLLSSKSDSQRRDSLSHLTTSLTSRPVTLPPPIPISTLVPTLCPLLLDSNSSVRSTLLRLLRVLPHQDIQDQISYILPYVRAGMTHLAADIRLSAVEALGWLIDVAGDEVVSCAGGWIKTWNCFLSVLGWHTEESARWSGNRASFGGGSKGKSGGGSVGVRVLGVLAEFMRAGLLPPSFGDQMDVEDDEEEGGDAAAGAEGLVFPVRAECNMVPSTAAPYAYLNLFGQPRDEEGEMYETREDRYRVFEERFRVPVERGLESARKEAGEAGRASSGVVKVLKEAVSYSEQDDE